jgi:hypothetical protein
VRRNRRLDLRPAAESLRRGTERPRLVQPLRWWSLGAQSSGEQAKQQDGRGTPSPPASQRAAEPVHQLLHLSHQGAILGHESGRAIPTRQETFPYRRHPRSGFDVRPCRPDCRGEPDSGTMIGVRHQSAHHRI